MIKDFISIDLETTGLDPKTDKIIEIAAIRYRDGKETDSFHTYVNPGVKVPERITELTGISEKQVEEAPSFGEIMPDLLAFLQEDILMAHHIIFDYSFLKRAVVNHNGVTNKGMDTFEKKGIDTLKIARKYYSDLESRSLPALCKHFEIPLEAHRASADAKATALLYFAMGNRILPKRPECEADFIPETLKYKVKKEGPATPAQKERLYKLIDKHKLEVDYSIESLTKNEASRYMDTILATYGR